MEEFYTAKKELVFKRELAHYPIFSKMMFDDAFFDVTKEEAARFLTLIDRYGLHDNIRIKLHKKYAPFVPQNFTKYHNAVLSFNLMPNVHRISRTGAVIYINGYTESEWKILTQENYSGISSSRYGMIRKKCLQRYDEKSLLVLSTKYGDILEDEKKRRNEEILISHNLPPDTQYTTLDSLHIDGITFNCWRLLHDDEYDPSQAILISNYHFLKRIGHTDDVAYIGDKYHKKLFPKEEPTFSQEEIQEAASFFDHYHENLLREGEKG